MASQNEPRILIIGLGNPLRSDDGLGWWAAQELCQTKLSQPIQIITQPQLTPELSLAASQADFVIFIDASQNERPGEIRCRRLVPELARGAFSHQLSPSGVLGLAEELYGTAAQGYLVSMGANCFDHGERLSETVIAALPQLVARVVELMRKE
jgi:hydrogenase maturation protease